MQSKLLIERNANLYVLDEHLTQEKREENKSQLKKDWIHATSKSSNISTSTAIYKQHSTRLGKERKSIQVACTLAVQTAAYSYALWRIQLGQYG